MSVKITSNVVDGRAKVHIDIQIPDIDEKRGGKPGRGGGPGGWVTISGTHVYIGGDGVPRQGPNGPKVEWADGDGGKPAAKPDPKPEPKPTPKPKPKPKPAEKPAPKAKPTKISGNKSEAENLIKSLDDADGAFGGALSKFLEKYPIKEVRVGKTDSTNQSCGVYNKGTGVLAVKPTTNTVFLMYDKGATVATDAAGDDSGKYQQATFLHEVGHHVLLTAMSKIPGAQKTLYADTVVNAYQKDSKKISKYADTQPHEYFAESFAAYKYNPKSLSKDARLMVEAVLAAGVGK